MRIDRPSQLKSHVQEDLIGGRPSSSLSPNTSLIRNIISVLRDSYPNSYLLEVRMDHHAFSICFKLVSRHASLLYIDAERWNEKRIFVETCNPSGSL